MQEIIRKILIFSLFISTMCNIIGGRFSTLNTAFADDDYSMITIEKDSGRVLYERNANVKRPMASTTKIATAITVIENCKNLEKVVKVPSSAVGVEGSSVYLQENESVKIIDLLYGLMLRSGNDCAVALAITVSGSVSDFSVLMNRLAQKVGATDTNFVNPHGLHDENHYTTASDLAKISAYAMKNPVFCEIVSTKRYVMPWEGHEYDRVMLNKNKILSSFDGGNGIKTGYTKRSGRCLVASAERNGMTVISVVLNCGPMFEECARLMEQAFNEYEIATIDYNDVNLCCAVEKGAQSFAELAFETVRYPIKRDGSERLSYRVNGVDSLSAPVKRDTKNGNFDVYLNNRLIFSQKLYTIYDVKQKGLTDFIREILTA